MTLNVMKWGTTTCCLSFLVMNSLPSKDTIFIKESLVIVLSLLLSPLRMWDLFLPTLFRSTILWFWKSDSQIQSSMCHFSKEAYLRALR